MKRIVFLAVVPLLVLSGCGSSDGSDPEAAALATVEAAYETFNSGDVDAWVEIRDRGSFYWSGLLGRSLLRWKEEPATRTSNASRWETGNGPWPMKVPSRATTSPVRQPTSILQGKNIRKRSNGS